MRTIKEAEKLTGITSQNIRYYERQKLLAPQRNSENSYREYSDEDISRLKMIRLFRSLDIPIGDIRRLFDGEVTLEDTIRLQVYRLETEKERLSDAIEFCGLIREEQLADMNVDAYLHEMEEREKAGSVFAQFLDDYSSVVRSEMIREFSFMPDDRCDTPGKFTEELLKFADQNNLHLTVTKESLSPRMFIDGVEYRAYRTSSRYGIVIHCEMLHPEDYIPEGMSEKKYRRYRILSIIALPLLIFIICNLWVYRSALLEYGWEGLAVALGITAVLFISDLGFIYYCYGKNFRG